MATGPDIPELINAMKKEGEDKELSTEPLNIGFNELPLVEMQKAEHSHNKPLEIHNYMGETENMQVATNINVDTANAVTQGDVGTAEGEVFFGASSVPKVACQETSCVPKECESVEDEKDRIVTEENSEEYLRKTSHQDGEDEKSGVSILSVAATEMDSEVTKPSEETEEEKNEREEMLQYSTKGVCISTEKESPDNLTDEDVTEKEEGAKENLGGPLVAAIIEETSSKKAAEDEGGKLEDNSSIPFDARSTKTTESSEKIDVTSIEDEKPSLVEKIEDICFQGGDNPEPCKEVSDTGSENIVKMSEDDIDNQNEILEKIVTADTNVHTTDAHEVNSEPKVDASFIRQEESLQGESEEIAPIEASTREYTDKEGVGVAVPDEYSKNERAEHEEQSEQSFLTKIEPGKEKLERSSDIASKETRNTESSQQVETITDFEEQMPVESFEEIIKEERKETTYHFDDIEKESPEEKNLSEAGVNEKIEREEIEIPKEFGHDSYFSHPVVDETLHLGGEKDQVTSAEAEEQPCDGNRTLKEEKRLVNEAYEATGSPDSFSLEKSSTEGEVDKELTSRTDNEKMDINNQIIMVIEGPDTDEKGKDTENQILEENHSVTGQLPDTTGEETIKCSREDEAKAEKPKPAKGEELETTCVDQCIPERAQEEENKIQDQALASIREKITAESSEKDEKMEEVPKQEVPETTEEGKEKIMPTEKETDSDKDYNESIEEKIVQENSQEVEIREENKSAQANEETENHNIEEIANADIPSSAVAERNTEENVNEKETDIIESKDEVKNSYTEHMEQILDTTCPPEETKAKTLKDEDSDTQYTTGASREIPSKETTENLVENSSVPHVYEKETEEEILHKAETPVTSVTEETCLKEFNREDKMQSESFDLASDKRMATVEPVEIGSDDVNVIAKNAEATDLGENKNMQILTAAKDGEKTVFEAQSGDHDPSPKIKDEREVSTGEALQDYISDQNLKEPYTLSSGECTLMATEATETTDETPEKVEASNVSTRSPLAAETTEEKILQIQDKSIDPEVHAYMASSDVEKGSANEEVHDDGQQLHMSPAMDTEMSTINSEGIELPKSIKTSDAADCSNIGELETLKDEKSQNTELNKDRLEDENPINDTSNEAHNTCTESTDTKKAILGQEYSTRNFKSSSEEDVKIEKMAIKVEAGDHSHEIEVSEIKSTNEIVEEVPMTTEEGQGTMTSVIEESDGDKDCKTQSSEQKTVQESSQEVETIEENESAQADVETENQTIDESVNAKLPSSTAVEKTIEESFKEEERDVSESNEEVKSSGMEQIEKNFDTTYLTEAAKAKTLKDGQEYDTHCTTGTSREILPKEINEDIGENSSVPPVYEKETEEEILHEIETTVTGENKTMQVLTAPKDGVDSEKVEASYVDRHSLLAAKTKEDEQLQLEDESIDQEVHTYMASTDIEQDGENEVHEDQQLHVIPSLDTETSITESEDVELPKSIKTSEVADCSNTGTTVISKDEKWLNTELEKDKVEDEKPVNGGSNEQCNTSTEIEKAIIEEQHSATNFKNSLKEDAEIEKEVGEVEAGGYIPETEVSETKNTSTIIEEVPERMKEGKDMVVPVMQQNDGGEDCTTDCIEEKTVQYSFAEDEETKENKSARANMETEDENTAETADANLISSTVVDESIHDSLKEDGRDVRESKEEVKFSDIELTEQKFNTMCPTEDTNTETLKDGAKQNQDRDTQSTTDPSKVTPPKETNEDLVENTSVPYVSEKETEEEILHKAETTVTGVTEEAVLKELNEEDKMKSDGFDVVSDNGPATTESFETGSDSADIKHADASDLDKNKNFEILMPKINDEREVSTVETLQDYISEQNLKEPYAPSSSEHILLTTEASEIADETLEKAEASYVSMHSPLAAETTEKKILQIQDKSRNPEKWLDAELEKDKLEDPVNETSNEACNTPTETEKASLEQEHSARNFKSSLKENVEIEKEVVGLEAAGQVRKIEVSERNSTSTVTEEKPESTEPREEPRSDSESVTEGQSNQIIPLLDDADITAKLAEDSNLGENKIMQIPTAAKEEEDESGEKTGQVQDETCHTSSKSEDGREVSASETPLDYTSEQNLEDSSTMSSGEHNHKSTEASETADETPEEDEASYITTHALLAADVTEDKLLHKQVEPTDPRDEAHLASLDTENNSASEEVHGEEQQMYKDLALNTEKNVTESKEVELQKRTETSEVTSCSDIGKWETLQDQKSLNDELDKDKMEAEKSVNDAFNEACNPYINTETAILEQNPESVELEPSEQLRRATESETEDQSNKKLPETKIEEDSNSVKDLNLECTWEKIIGQDFQEGLREMNEEVEPKLDAENQMKTIQNGIETIKDISLTEEASGEVKMADETEKVKEQIVEEGSCTTELQMTSASNEIVNKITDPDPLPIENLEVTNYSENRETAKSHAAEDLNWESEGSSVMKAPEEDIKNAIEEPINVTSPLVEEVLEEKIDEQNKKETDSCNDKTNLAPVTLNLISVEPNEQLRWNPESGAENQSNKTHSETNTAKIEEGSNSVKDLNLESIEEQVIANDFQEGQREIYEEIEPKFEAENQIKKTQDGVETIKVVSLTEEVSRAVEKAEESENINRQIVEEESCRTELQMTLASNEIASKITNPDPVPIENLEVTDSIETTEPLKLQDAKDLSWESEEVIKKDKEKPVSIISSALELSAEDIKETDIAPIALNRGLVELEAHEGVRCATELEAEDKRNKTLHETKIEEDNNSVKDMTLESTGEKVIGQDIQEGGIDMTGEVEPTLEAENEIKKTQTTIERKKDVLLTEENRGLVELEAHEGVKCATELEAEDKRNKTLHETKIEEDSTSVKDMTLESIGEKVIGKDIQESGTEMIGEVEPTLEAENEIEETHTTIERKKDVILTEENRGLVELDAHEEVRCATELEAEDKRNKTLHEEKTEEDSTNVKDMTLESTGDEVIRQDIQEGGTEMTEEVEPTLEAENEIEEKNTTIERKKDVILTEENRGLVELEAHEGVKCATELESEDKINKTLHEAKTEEDSTRVKDMTLESTREKVIGQDIQEGGTEITGEVEPTLETENEIEERQTTIERKKDVILTEEVSGAIEKTKESENVKEQIIKEESCTLELQMTLASNEMIINPDPATTESLEVTVSCENTETVKTLAAKDLDSESKASSITKAPEKDTKKDNEKSTNITNSMFSISKETVEEENTDSCNDKMHIAPVTLVTEETASEEVQLDEKSIRDFDTTSDDKILVVKTSSIGLQGEEVDSAKLEDNSRILSPLTIEGANVNNESENLQSTYGVEVEEPVTSDAISKSKKEDGEDIHEIGKSPTVDRTDADKLEDEINEVLETISEPNHQGVDSVIAGEILLHQTLPSGNLTEQVQQQSYGAMPSKEENCETTSKTEKIEEENTKKDENLVNEILESSFATRTEDETCLQNEDPRELEVSNLNLALIEDPKKNSLDEAPKEESISIEEVTSVEPQENVSKISFVDSPSESEKSLGVRKTMHYSSKETSEEDTLDSWNSTNEAVDLPSHCSTVKKILIEPSILDFHKTEKALESMPEEELAKSEEQINTATTEPKAEENQSGTTNEASETTRNEIKIETVGENKTIIATEKEVAKDSQVESPDKETDRNNYQEHMQEAVTYHGEKEIQELETTVNAIQSEELSKELESTILDKNNQKQVTSKDGAVEEPNQDFVGGGLINENLQQEAEGKNVVEAPTKLDLQKLSDDTNCRDTNTGATTLSEEVNDSEFELVNHDEGKESAINKEIVTRNDVVEDTSVEVPHTYVVAEEAPNEVGQEVEEISQAAPKKLIHETIEEYDVKKDIEEEDFNGSESLKDDEKPEHTTLESTFDGSDITEDLNLKEQGVSVNEARTSSPTESIQKEKGAKANENLVNEEQSDIISEKQITVEMFIPEEVKYIKDEAEHINDEEQVVSSKRERKVDFDEAEIHCIVTADEDGETTDQSGKLDVLSRTKDSGMEITQKDSTVDLTEASKISQDVEKLEKPSLAISDKQIQVETYPNESAQPRISTGSNKDIPLVPQEPNAKTFQEVEDLKSGNASVAEPEVKAVECGEEKTIGEESKETTEESSSIDSAKNSLSDLLKRSIKGTSQVTELSIEEREPKDSKELQADKGETTDVGEAKEDETKYEVEEGDEEQKVDLGTDAPVMVEASSDMNTKVVAHKKSHNILSGVGSKVKHSIAKVKKVITGKSSHPKPSSPK